MRMGMGLLIVLSLLLSGIMLAPPADSGEVAGPSVDAFMSMNEPVPNAAPNSVVFFEDDMENGAMKWTHSSTLVNINGESPIDYYSPGDVLDTSIITDWNSTMSSGIQNNNTQFHSFNESFSFEEPLAGNVNKTAVTETFNIMYNDVATLSFWHKYNLTPDQNGVFLQVGFKDITQGGINDWDWKYVNPASYTGNLSASETVSDTWGVPISGCWNNVSGNGTYDWEYVEIDLLDFVHVAPSMVRVKFNYTQFGGGSGDGWYVDDVRVTGSRMENFTIEPGFSDLWQLNSTVSHSGSSCWSNVDPDTGDVRGGIDNSLTTIPINITDAVDVNFTAYMKFNLNENTGMPPDGFRVEVTTDGGISWNAINLGVRCAWNVSGTGADMDDGSGDGKTWSGLTDSGNPVTDDYWVEANTLSRLNANLSAFAGNVIQLRFRLVTSNNVSYQHNNSLNSPYPGFGGFYLDDVEVRGTVPPPENIPPFALNYTPNGTAAPTDSTIQITWNETMNWTSVENAFSYTDGVSNYSSANGTWLHDSATNISTFTLTDDFAHETQYNVTINCTATDIIGNMLDQDGNGTGGYWPDDVLEWNFTTVDETPRVISIVPANGQIDVDPARFIKITFSEPMNQSSVEDAFSYTNGTVTWNIGNGTEFWNTENTEFTFSPLPSLELNQTFTVLLNGSLARDIGGRPIGSNFTWSFTTWAEPPPPHITDTYPISGSFNVPVNTYINLAFDLEMDIESVQNAFSYTDGNNTWGAVDGVVDWFSGNKLFSFQPDENLNFDSTYTIRIDTNATSIHGNTLDGNNNGIAEANDDYVFYFSTAVEPPIVESHFPAADQTGIGVSLSAIYINFSKEMDITSVTNGVSIYPNTDYMPSFSADQKELTLVLNENLLEGAQYRVTVMGTAMDIAGTRLDGNGDGAAGDKFTFTFLTVGAEIIERPMIMSVFPSNNATVPVDPFFVTITFSEMMNTTSVKESFSFKNGSAELNGTIAWSVSGMSMRFTPEGPLEYNTTYTVSISGNAKDVRGLTLGNSSTWHYITEAEDVPASMGDYALYGAIIVLLIMTIMLYSANRSLRMDLRKNRVMLKRAMKQSGLTEEDLKTKPKKPEVEKAPDLGEVEKAVPEEPVQIEPEAPEETVE